MAPGAAPVTSDALIARALRLAGEPGPAARRDDLATVLARFSARGITSIREAGVDAGELELFHALRRDGRLPVRCDLLWRVPEGSDLGAARQRIQEMPAGDLADPYLRLTGVKMFVDGRIADAAISGGAGPDHASAEPFRMTPEDLWAIVAESLARGTGAACHAVGDRAVRTVLDVYERALAAGLAADPRQLTVEHALNCTPETIRRLAASGVGVSTHPGIVYEFADEVRRYWGGENSARAAPVRDMVSAGVQVAAGSDGDVPPFDPMRNIWFMVTRTGRTGGPIGPDQAVARSLAFDLYTRRGAALLGVGERRGELRPGPVRLLRDAGAGRRPGDRAFRGRCQPRRVRHAARPHRGAWHRSSAGAFCPRSLPEGRRGLRAAVGRPGGGPAADTGARSRDSREA